MDDQPAHLQARRGTGPRPVMLGLLTMVVVISLLAVGYAWAPKEVSLQVNGDTRIVQTRQADVAGLLEEQEVQLNETDLVEPGLDTPLETGMEVAVRRVRPFQVKVDGETREFESAQPTVARALEEGGIELGPLDRVEPDQESPLEAGMKIEVIRVHEERVTTEVTLPYPVQRRSDDSLLRGQSKTVQAGEEGLAERLLQITYENGAKVREEILMERVIKEPVPQVIATGTVGTVNRGSQSLNFREMLVLDATAYSPDPRCTGAYADGYTATGQRAGKGVAAVDPQVIPLGTRLYVEGYGYALAADVGAAIRGNMIDLCFDTHEEALRFGRRQVKVYILE